MAHRTNPNGIKNIVKKLDKKGKVKVGFFSTSKYPDGNPVAYIAAIHEFGFPEGKIPARSFMRSTIKEKKTAWREQVLIPMFNKLLAGAVSLDFIAEHLGQVASGDMRKTISEIQEPALKKSTISARLARYVAKNPKKKPPETISKPLVETGQMIASLTYAVTDEE